MSARISFMNLESSSSMKTSIRISIQKKSICCIPFWIVKQSTPTTDLTSEAGMSKFDPVGVGNDATFQAIFSANHYVDMEPTLYPQEDDKTLIDIAFGPDNCNKNKPHKMPYHRVSVILQQSHKTELMKIEVLKHDDNSKREVDAHRNETKKSLPLNVFTDDIDQACELVVI